MFLSNRKVYLNVLRIGRFSQIYSLKAQCQGS